LAKAIYNNNLDADSKYLSFHLDFREQKLTLLFINTASCRFEAFALTLASFCFEDKVNDYEYRLKRKLSSTFYLQALAYTSHFVLQVEGQFL